MAHRTIVKSFKTGKVSLLRARKAAAVVKSRRLKRKAAGKGGGKKSLTIGGSVSADSWLAKRYLGHFGSSASREFSGTKSSGRKGLRRAS